MTLEQQIETIGKAKANGIMSVETSVEELYGDTKDDNWKKEEVQRQCEVFQGGGG